MDYRNLCQNCGGDLRKVTDTHYACVHCNTVYSTEKIESYAEKMHKLFDCAKLELISNARQNLYKALKSDNISEKEVHESCVEIKKYLPDDFQANFYDLFLSSSPRDVAKMIRKINVKENFESLEIMLTFLIKSLEKEFVLDTMALIEKAYKGGGSNDLVKYREYATRVQEEAQKIDDCVYLTTYPRDVFVAYSSKDIEKTLELVDELEAQGLSCFISIRNLRHGAGSRENYEMALKEAMDNCTSFVFVSSSNSRDQGCDALRIEIPYIKKKDIENAKGYAQSTYSNIPSEFKKPRVEYMLEESKRVLAADRIVNEFFCGYERVYAPIDVAQRVMEQSSGDVKDSNVNPVPQSPTVGMPKSKRVKFCVSCFSKCYEDMEQCDVCGETNFASSLNEAKRLNKEEKERKKKKEKLQKTKEKNKNQKEKAERKKAPKKIKEPRQKIPSKNMFSVIAWILAIIVIGVLIGLSFVFVNLRAWFIASAIAVAYVFISVWLKIIDKDIFMWYIFSSSALIGSSAVLIHISGMFAYVLCFAIALILIPIIIAITVGSYDIEEKEIKAFSAFAFIGAAFLFISVGACFAGLIKALIIGCGIGVTLIVWSLIARKTEKFGFHLPTIWVLLGVLLFILMWRNYFFTIFAICVLAGGIISGFIYSDVESDTGFFALFGGIALLFLALLNIWVFEPKAGNELIIDRGKLQTYAGTQEVVVIPEEVTTINDNAFQFSEPHKNLREVVFHNKLTVIGEAAFKNCDKLENVTIPGSVETVSKKAFNGCDSLKSVTLEQGVTVIGEKAFYKCKNLEEVIIPISVTDISDAAFRECNKLSKIYYAGTEEDWNKISKDWWISTGDKYSEYEIIYNYVPETVDTEDSTDITDNTADTETTETVEPAMYCVLPRKNFVF